MPLSITCTPVAQHAHHGLQYLHGSFTFAGSTNNPDAAEGKPFAVDGSDMTRADAGEFDLVVPGRGSLDILAVQATLFGASGLGTVSVKAITESTRTIRFHVITASTGADLDPADGDKLFVSIIVKSRQV